MCDSATPWTAAYQTPASMGFSRQEYWSGLPLPSPNKCMLLLLLSRFSRVQLCATPQTAAHQAPPSLGFSRQEHWSGLPFTSPKQMHTRILFKVWSVNQQLGHPKGRVFKKSRILGPTLKSVESDFSFCQDPWVSHIKAWQVLTYMLYLLLYPTLSFTKTEKKLFFIYSSVIVNNVVEITL